MLHSPVCQHQVCATTSDNTNRTYLVLTILVGAGTTVDDGTAALAFTSIPSCSGSSCRRPGPLQRAILAERERGGTQSPSGRPIQEWADTWAFLVPNLPER